MICKRCEQYIPKNSRRKDSQHCKHCFAAIYNQSVINAGFQLAE